MQDWLRSPREWTQTEEAWNLGDSQVYVIWGPEEEPDGEMEKLWP